MKKNLLNLTSHELNMFMKEHGVAAFHGTQVRKWLYQGVESFAEMTDLSKELRAWLDEYCSTGLLKIKRLLKSSQDGTCKFLFDLGDGNYVESVLMKYNYGYSVCVSSQVGCKMGCRFCASTGVGFVRNLTAAEMLGQVISINRERNIRVNHIVVMGVGEPMDNYDNVLKFFKEAHKEDGLGISFRHMSLSTCGVVPGINRLAQEQLPVTLAISLHSPFNDERSRIMPINNKYNLDELINACRNYIAMGGRRITFEYAMIKGENDDRNHANALCTLLSGVQAHVNLIPVNEVPGAGYTRSDTRTTDTFCKILEGKGIDVTVRRELGSDINAACGQLRRTEEENG